MDYMTVKEASATWGLGSRIVTLYCAEGRIEGVVKKGNLWLIPKDATRPVDKRRRKACSQARVQLTASRSTDEQKEPAGKWPFISLYEEKDLFVQIIKQFPFPMHICARDGTMLLANDAYLKFAKITNPRRLYKKHNILLNPNLERWGVKDFVVQAFEGELVHVYDVKVPYQEIIERLGDEKELVSESMFHNMTALPIRGSNNELLFVVFIFVTSRSYRDREEIIKGKEYIDNHWQEEFDIDKLAAIVHMSRYHNIRLFKQHTGMTPLNYYQEVKISKIKEKLCDSSLSITQAFAACGVDYNGNVGKLFKRKTGQTPSQYREQVSKKL